MENTFLPVNKSDLEKRGWQDLDFVFVSGDAYVDHPSFAVALLGRWLSFHGYKVGVIPQPDVNNIEAFQILGRPRLGFLISAGAMDSMVSNYTANNKPRSSDAYAHGGVAGNRPDRALITYTTKVRQAYKGVPVLIGGIEASLRRTSHYDYWSNTVRRSILLDSKADILMYGMGENSILELGAKIKEIAKNSPDGFATSKEVAKIRGVRGTCYRTSKKEEIPSDAIFLPSYQEVSANTKEGKIAFAKSYIIQESNTDSISAKPLVEQAEERFLVQEPPSHPLSQEQYDKVMELPYTRKWHPIYDKPAANGKTGVPALEEVLFSLTSCRGCFGACSFCAITFHQGKRIQTRSIESLKKEAITLTKHPDFKGYIHDVGGPTANFRHDACEKQKEKGACPNRECLGAIPCKNVNVDHREYVELLRTLRKIPGVKKVFIRSGIRFDYLILDKDKTFFKELCEHHISGQLKVAPEHVSNKVLKLVRKSSHEVYEHFASEYAKINKELGKKQFLVPYYIAGLPGAGLEEALEVALYLKKTGFVPDQVQDFYPTPGNLATCMYYTGLNPHEKDQNGNMEEIYVPKGGHERRLQRALLQFNKKENQSLVREALEKIGRKDLIGILR